MLLRSTNKVFLAPLLRMDSNLVLSSDVKKYQHVQELVATSGHRSPGLLVELVAMILGSRVVAPAGLDGL
jgi:hypothetical protein